jgi:hypothetical protein
MLSDQRGRRDTLFGILGAIALGVLLSFYVTQIFEVAPSQTTNPHLAEKRERTNNSQHIESSLGDWLTHDEAGFFTLWLVVVGLGQACLFLWQLRLMGEGLADAKKAADAANLSSEIAAKSLDLSRETAERQLRAYVGVQHICLKCPGLSDQNYMPIERRVGHVNKDFIVVTIKNFGLTPAYDVRIWVNWTTTNFAESLPYGFSYQDYEIKESPSPISSQHILQRDQQNDSNIAIFDLRPFISTQKQQSMLYIYGHIDYIDIYSRRWSAVFCQSWEPWSDAGLEFVPYQEHNGETELTTA